MIQLDKQLGRIQQLPSDERLRALKRIIPKKTLPAILRKCHRRQRHCKRLPGWFMVWFMVAMGLYFRDDYCQVYRWMQGKGHAPGAFPQALVLGLCEIGAHAIWRHQRVSG